MSEPMEDKRLERSVEESVEQTANRLMGGLLSMHLNRSDLMMWLGAERDKLRVVEKALDDQLAIQLAEPSIYTDSYMAGLTNGMLLAKTNFGGDYKPISSKDKGRADLQSQITALKSQLPEGMEHCTIRFIECPVGHGRLTADNWTKSQCFYCEIADLQAKLSVCKEAMESMKVSMGMWLDRQDGHADPELCRSQHRHALRLYEKALAQLQPKKENG